MEEHRKSVWKRLSAFFAGCMNTVSYVLLIIGVSLLISTVGLLLVNDFLALVQDDIPITIQLDEETPTEEVAELLKEKKVIDYPFLFKLLMKFKKVETFHPGTYELNRNMDYGQLKDTFFATKVTRSVVTVFIQPAKKALSLFQTLFRCSSMFSS